MRQSARNWGHKLARPRSHKRALGSGQPVMLLSPTTTHREAPSATLAASPIRPRFSLRSRRKSPSSEAAPNCPGGSASQPSPASKSLARRLRISTLAPRFNSPRIGKGTRPPPRSRPASSPFPGGTVVSLDSSTARVAAERRRDTPPRFECSPATKTMRRLLREDATILSQSGSGAVAHGKITRESSGTSSKDLALDTGTPIARSISRQPERI